MAIQRTKPLFGVYAWMDISSYWAEADFFILAENTPRGAFQGKLTVSIYIGASDPCFTC